MAEERLELEKPPQAVAQAIERSQYPAARASYGYGYGYTSQDEEMHLRDMWRIIRKRKWLVVSVTVIATTIVAIQMVRTRSLYQASTLVEVDKGTPGASKTGEMIIQDNDIDTLKTKLLAVRTQPVLQDVVKTLRLDRDSRFIEKEPTRPLLSTIKAIVGHPTAPTSMDVSDADSDQPAPAPDGGDIDQKVLESYARMVDGGLSVELVRDTRAIRISYEHNDPREAALIANQVAKSFIDRSFQNQTSQFTHTSEWLDTSTRQLKARVEQAEQALADYTKTHNMFSTDGKESLTTDKLTHLHDQLNRSQTDVILKQSMYEAVKAGRIAELPEAYSDQRLSMLKGKVEDLQAQTAELSVKFGPKNPNLIQANRELSITEQQLQAGIQALQAKLKGEYERALADEKALESALETAKSEAVLENQNEIQFSILKQDVDTAKALYTDFLQKTNQANLQVAEQAPNMHVLQPALTPSVPVSPKRKSNTLIAFFLSLAGGLGLTFFLEYLDTTIKSVEDVARFVQLPTLGVIPAIASAVGTRRELKGRSRQSAQSLNDASVSLMRPTGSGLPSTVIAGQMIAKDSHSSAAEAYRALRTSVLLSSAGHPPRTLLITSGQPGEGKTTTVVNTAISLAQLGSEVLIIDADLRKPSIHRVFGIDSSRGLSTYLSRDVEVDSLISKHRFPHLSIMASGPIPPNPAELISSDRFRDLLKQLSERYDHILIDSPPLINVTDPVILSTMVEGVVLVICWGKSTRDTARRVRSELTTVGAKIFGVVLNNVDFKREGYDDYYYYRYHTDYGRASGDAANV